MLNYTNVGMCIMYASHSSPSSHRFCVFSFMWSLFFWVKKKKVESGSSSQKALVFNNALVTFSHFFVFAHQYKLRSQIKNTPFFHLQPKIHSHWLHPRSLSLSFTHKIPYSLMTLSKVGFSFFFFFVWVGEYVGSETKVLGNAQASDFCPSCLV